MLISTIFQLYLDGQFYWWMKTGVSRENQRPVANHRQTLSHNVVSSTTRLSRVRTHNFIGDRHQFINSLSWSTLKFHFKFHATKKEVMLIWRNVVIAYGTCTCSWIYNYLCNQCLSPIKLWVDRHNLCPNAGIIRPWLVAFQNIVWL
jgi:hypothetical protein